MRLDAGAQTAQGVHRLMVAVGIVLRYLHGLQLFDTCLLGNLILALVGVVLQVTHVGDVAHVAYLITQMLQVAEYHVERDGRTGMTQMRVTVHRRTTDIHAHVGSMQRLKALLLTSKRIVDNKFRFHFLMLLLSKTTAKVRII